MAYTIKGKTGEWEVVVGLEVHIEILSASKLFSGASADYNPSVPPNTQVSFVDAAMPGMLPVLNRECVRQAIKMGLGLNAEISRRSRFARKQYFYPDLPQGYQISQPAEEPPVVGRGFVEIVGDPPSQSSGAASGAPKRILVQRAHLEQDAGKNKHDANPTKTFTDLNRSGVALLEIVSFLDPANSTPDQFITSPDEAEKYLREIRSIARALGVSNANMEEGSMRADVNVSVRPVGAAEFRTRTETKNMVSFKFIKTAIEYEARRQVEIYESGGRVSQDTMHYNQADGTTSVMRSKEDALDYRYFPDPDLLPLVITDEEIEGVRREMPELPAARKARYVEMGVAPFDADRIGEDRELYEYFDKVLAAPTQDLPSGAGKSIPPTQAGAGKVIANWLLGDLAAHPEYKMEPEYLAELVDMILLDEISSKNAKDIFAKLLDGVTGSPREIADKYNFKQSTDTGAVEAAADKIIAENPAQVADYRAGKTGLLGFFVGQVMRLTGGTANPKVVNEIVAGKLK